jgi:hypothetical protein
MRSAPGGAHRVGIDLVLVRSSRLEPGERTDADANRHARCHSLGDRVDGVVEEHR